MVPPQPPEPDGVGDWQRHKDPVQWVYLGNRLALLHGRSCDQPTQEPLRPLPIPTEMNPRRQWFPSWILLLAMLTALKCRDSASTPPAPVALEQLPTLLEAAFAKAKPELKDLSSQAIAAIQGQNYPNAYLDLQ